MAELKEVKVFYYIIDNIIRKEGLLYRTARLEIHDGDKNVGYYRIWHDRTTESIAFYGEHDRHGVLPPQEYKAIPTNHKMIAAIEKDLNLMGFTIPDGHKTITDGMLTGDVEFPKYWAGWFEDELVEPKQEDIFKIDK